MDTISGDDPMQTPLQKPLGGLDPADLLKQGAAEDTILEGAASSFNPPPIEELTAIFPQFEILELIGKGGMGAVYKVRQRDLDRIVALKILPPAVGQSPEFSARFTREARALAKLNHPGIVTLHEFGQQDGLYFILMEFVDGLNLGQLMKSDRISPREALAIVPQICDALQFAHDQGVVHRDIKPENILLDRLGRVKVADFGIAKIVAPDSSFVVPPSGGFYEEDRLKAGLPTYTEAGKIIGTPQYMAPEQIDHPSDVDHRADIYALGVVFYQMLTGELPNKELEAPSRKIRLDVRLDEIVLRAMEKEPELRYQTAHEFRTVVDSLQAPAKPPSPPKRGKLRRWWWVFLVMFSLGPLIGLAAGSVLAYINPSPYQESVLDIRRLPLLIGALLGLILSPFIAAILIRILRRMFPGEYPANSRDAANTETSNQTGPGVSNGVGVDSFAIASLVLGICSFVLGPFGSLPAIVFGHLSRWRIRRNYRLSGNGIATTGLILGYVFLITHIVLLLVFFGLRPKSVTHVSAGHDDALVAPTSDRSENSESPPSSGASPLLMTEFGEFKSEQSLWSIRVSAQDRTLHISRQAGSSGIGTSLSPDQWRAQNGWFAFIEDETHVWAYNGDQKLMLVEVTPEKSTLYDTETILRTVPNSIQPLILQTTLGRVGAKSGNTPDAGKTEIGRPEVAVLAERWLTGIDAGNYGQSWKDAAKFFQSAITEGAWVAALEGVRKPLGAVKSRKIRAVNKASSLPGAPDGEYFIIQFDSAFAAKAEAVETVTFKLEEGGVWKAAGYFIR